MLICLLSTATAGQSELLRHAPSLPLIISIHPRRVSKSQVSTECVRVWKQMVHHTCVSHHERTFLSRRAVIVFDMRPNHSVHPAGWGVQFIPDGSELIKILSLFLHLTSALSEPFVTTCHLLWKVWQPNKCFHIPLITFTFWTRMWNSF